MATYDAGTIKATVDANTRPYTTAMLRAAATTRTATRMMERDTNRASGAVAGLTGNTQVLTKQFLNLQAAMGGLMVGGIVSIVRPAAAAIDSLSGGVVILSKSLTDMQGVIGAVPVGLSALVQGFGAVKFATAGLGDAVKAFAEGDNEKIREALKSTSEEAGEFAKALTSLKPEMDKVRNAAAEGLFPGLTRGLDAAVQNLPILKETMAGTARVMGDLAEDAGRFLGSEAFGDRFQTIAARNNDLLRAAGRASIQFADALTLIMVKAKPMTDYLGELLTDLGNWVQNTTRASAATGELTAYFQRGADSFREWGAILGNLGGFLRELFAAAQPAADEFRSWLVDTTQGWKDWSRSAEGAGAMAEFFDRITPPLKAVSRLFGDLIRTIWDLGNTDEAQQGLIALSEALRTGLLPAMLAISSDIGPKAAVSFAKLAEAIVRVLNVASFNPLMDMIAIVSEMISGITKLIALVPGLGDLLGVLSAIFLASRIVQIQAFVAAVYKVGAAFAAMKTAAIAASGGLGLFSKATTAASYASSTAVVKMKMAFGAMTAVEGITLGMVGPTQKLTGAMSGLHRATGALGAGFAGLVKGAGPLLIAMVGFEMVNAFKKAHNYAEKYRWEIESIDYSTYSGLKGGLDVLKRMADEHRELMDEFKGGGGFFKWMEAKSVERGYQTTQAELANVSNAVLATSNNLSVAMSKNGKVMTKSLDEIMQMMDAAGIKVEDFAGMTGDDLTQAIGIASDKLITYYNTQIAADESTKTFYNSMMTLNDELATTSDKANAAYDALVALNAGMTQSNDPAMTMAKTLDEVRSGLNKNNLALSKNGKHLAWNNARYREGTDLVTGLRDEALRLASAKFAETEAQKGTGAAVNQLNRRYKTQYDRVWDVIQAVTHNKKRTQELMDVLMRAPKEVRTAIKVNREEILRAIRNGEDLISAIDKANRTEGHPKVKVEGEKEARGVIGRISDAVHDFVSKQYRASVTVTGILDSGSDEYEFVKSKGGTIPLGYINAFATGGQVLGPGTGTSDSIPAWLSNGEFVINAEAVRKYGSEMFAALNAQKFAAGGLAGGGVVVGGDTKLYHQTLKALFEKLLKGLKGEGDARRNANRELERILKSTTKSLEKNLQQMVKALTQQAKAALQQAKQAYRQRVNEIKQGIRGFGAVTQTGGTEYLSGQGLLEEMRARAAAASNFASQYDQLKALGLNQKSLSQIVAAGPQEGAAIAAALLEGSKAEVKARLAEINALEQAITKVGREFGTTVAVDEGKRADIREAKQRLRALQKTEVTVKEGAVQVNLNLAGVAKDDREAIRDTVDKAVSRAFREFIRELKASR